MLLVGLGPACVHTTRAYGQTTDTGQSTTGTASSDGSLNTGVCPQPPCSMGAPTGRKSTAPPPGPRVFTAFELEEMRYGRLFGEIAGQEQMAKQEEDAGHSEAAASWHGYFANKSGLTQEEADIVKKIAAKYSQDWLAFQSKERVTILAVRHANPGVRMSRFNSPEIAALEQERVSLFTNMKAELIRALGSKSFTRLDSYTLHSHDNARYLNSETSPSDTEQQSKTPVLTGNGEK